MNTTTHPLSNLLSGEGADSSDIALCAKPHLAKKQPFFINLLVLGWSIGLLVAALVLRYGLGAESFAWVAIFAFAPISGIYYPIDVLPVGLQAVALALPSSHVFEGMRAVMFNHVFRYDLFINAVFLNVVYLTLAGFVFTYAFKIARRLGLLLSTGE